MRQLRMFPFETPRRTVLPGLSSSKWMSATTEHHRPGSCRCRCAVDGRGLSVGELLWRAPSARWQGFGQRWSFAHGDVLPQDRVFNPQPVTVRAGAVVTVGCIACVP
jgi:hypothetical protein